MKLRVFEAFAGYGSQSIAHRCESPVVQQLSLF